MNYSQFLNMIPEATLMVVLLITFIADFCSSKRGAIQILDDATIEAMKAKRARDKARDEAEKQKDAIASGEQTDWQEAMKEWNEWESSKEK